MSVFFDNRAKKWCLEIKVDGRRLRTSDADKEVLERMKSIIKSNRLSYDKAKILATDYRKGKILPGYIGHKYLNPSPGYRIISAYSNGNGFIHSLYTNPEEAWYDPRIQVNIASAGIQYADYNQYLLTVESGRPWTIMNLTILRCKISMHGRIRIIKK